MRHDHVDRRASTRRNAAIVAAELAFFGLSFCSAASARPLEWQKLSPLPDKEGFAGVFAGVSNGALVVAGGANFPNKKPAEGGAKVWHDQVFVLDKPNGAWRIGGKLPRPLAYGASVSIPAGLICLGGSDERTHYAEVFVISWSDERLDFRPLPPLPRPCANLCAALIDQRLYVAGGLETPTATKALKNFWRLDLSQTSPTWQELDPWPGPERMLATASATSNAFYLVGGAALEPDPAGKPKRLWLRDACRFDEHSGWTRLADLPTPAVATPSPMPMLDGRPLLLGGDDGTQLNLLISEHRGFRRSPLSFDPQKNAWTEQPPLPFAFVTTPVVRWRDLIVLPGGEIKPGLRSTEVWAAPLE